MTIKECCRTCEYLDIEQADIGSLVRELSGGDTCVMCDSDYTRYDANEKCREYLPSSDIINEKDCRFCKFFRPTPFNEDEYGATIYACRELSVCDFEKSCNKFELWDGEFEIDEW